MTPTELIISALRAGENNGVSLAELINICGLDNRNTRLVIEDLRRKGTVICSSENGYFYPATIEELTRYVRRESARSASIDLTLQSAKTLLEEWGGVV